MEVKRPSLVGQVRNWKTGLEGNTQALKYKKLLKANWRKLKAHFSVYFSMISCMNWNYSYSFSLCPYSKTEGEQFHFQKLWKIMFSHFLKFETMIIDTFLFEGLADERNMWWWWTSLIFACSTLINSLRCSLTILEIIYCNISSMEVLYTICFRIILLSFRKSTMTRIIPVLVQGTCGSDSIYGWNRLVEKFHLRSEFGLLL